MGFGVIVLIALGLSMDTFAVSLSLGSLVRSERARHALRISLCFAFFQMIMPVAGWLLASSLRDAIALFDHWIVFGLLFMIGLKMIVESFSSDCSKSGEPLSGRRLVVLSLVTSFDALAAGISFAFLEYPLIFCAGIIGAVTFLVAFAGVFAGHWCCCRIGRQAEMVGGLVLIALAIRILTEHWPL